MPTAADLTKQKKQAHEQQRQTEHLIVKQKELLRKEVSDIDASISALHGQRSKAAAELSRLG